MIADHFLDDFLDHLGSEFIESFLHNAGHLFEYFVASRGARNICAYGFLEGLALSKFFERNLHLLRKWSLQRIKRRLSSNHTQYSTKR